MLAGFLFVHKYYIIPIYYFFRRKLFRYRKRPSRTILALFSPRGILNECGGIVPVHVWSGETPIDEPYASSSSSDKQDKSTFPMMSPAAAMHRNPSTGDRVVTSEEQCEGRRVQKGRICTHESNDVGKKVDFAHPRCGSKYMEDAKAVRSVRG